MKRNESKEDYLEAILKISMEKNSCKSIDVARLLNFSKPSVSVAMKKLKEEELIIVEHDGNLILTEKGTQIAKNTLEKHEYLTDLFIKIGVEKSLAEEQACEIEHSITEDTFEKLKAFLNK